MRMASPSVSKRNRGATGPKVSSRATNMAAVTSVSTVGSKNVPPSAWRLPPCTMRAPLAVASARCCSTLASALASMSGPWSVGPFSPSPTRSWATACTSLAVNASYTGACTSRRLAHTHVCPVLRYLLAMAPATAASRSASSNTMNGALPPSSSDSFFTVPALAFLREPFDEGSCVGDLALGLRERLALLSGHQRRQVLQVRHQQLVPATQHRRALPGGVRGPRRECLACCLDGAPCLGGAHLGHRADRFARRRIQHLVRGAAHGVHPLAADEGTATQQIRIAQFHDTAVLMQAFSP